MFFSDLFLQNGSMKPFGCFFFRNYQDYIIALQILYVFNLSFVRQKIGNGSYPILQIILSQKCFLQGYQKFVRRLLLFCFQPVHILNWENAGSQRVLVLPSTVFMEDSSNTHSKIKFENLSSKDVLPDYYVLFGHIIKYLVSKFRFSSRKVQQKIIKDVRFQSDQTS